MDIAETTPGDGDHSNGRVELHCAGTKWDHRVGEGNVLLAESLDVSHHVGLRVLLRVDVLLEEFRRSLDFSWHLLVLSLLVVVELSFNVANFVGLQVTEHFNDLVECVSVGQFVEGD